MKPMSEVFELPVNFRSIKSKDVASDFDYVVIDNHGADVAECYSHTDGQHAAHAINSHDLLVESLEKILSQLESNPNCSQDFLFNCCADAAETALAALKQARGD